MAQVLKDEQRNKILNAAKAEFAKNGIEHASLREIAKHADMTVGNLYRYFKNKQALADTILNPLMSELDLITLSMLSSENLHHDEIIMDEQVLKTALTALADCMVELESNHPLEMLILINDEKINQTKNTWLNNVTIQILTAANLPELKTQPQLEMLSKMISTALFSGLREGICLKCNSDMTKDSFKIVLRLYLLQCFTLFKFN